MSKRFFDFDDGDFGMPISDNMAIDSDGDLMMRMSRVSLSGGALKTSVVNTEKGVHMQVYLQGCTLFSFKVILGVQMIKLTES